MAIIVGKMYTKITKIYSVRIYFKIPSWSVRFIEFFSSRSFVWGGCVYTITQLNFYLYLCFFCECNLIFFVKLSSFRCRLLISNLTSFKNMDLYKISVRIRIKGTWHKCLWMFNWELITNYTFVSFYPKTYILKSTALNPHL